MPPCRKPDCLLPKGHKSPHRFSRASALDAPAPARARDTWAEKWLGDIPTPPALKWTDPGSKPIEDIHALVRRLTEDGYVSTPPPSVSVGSGTGHTIPSVTSTPFIKPKVTVEFPPGALTALGTPATTRYEVAEATVETFAGITEPTRVKIEGRLVLTPAPGAMGPSGGTLATTTSVPGLIGNREPSHEWSQKQVAEFRMHAVREAAYLHSHSGFADPAQVTMTAHRLLDFLLAGE